MLGCYERIRAVRRPELGEIDSSDPNLPAVLGTNIAANGRGVVGNSTSTSGTSVLGQAVSGDGVLAIRRAAGVWLVTALAGQAPAPLPPAMRGRGCGECDTDPRQYWRARKKARMT